ncbi:hypothetical protein [Microbispora bryophytorum]|uniref:hypothetical protein n=1 Tax=Microbispora bryophytorum TaxID=1460882 RepID=UPI0033DC47F1
MTMTDPRRTLPAGDRLASACPICITATVIEDGWVELAHDARCPLGALGNPRALVSAQGAVQSREGAS